MAENTVSKSTQSVQTDDLSQLSDGFRIQNRRKLLTNFSHALLLYPPSPTLSQTSASWKFSSFSHHPKAKLILAYETRDHDGKKINQPCLTIDEAEKQVRLLHPSADSSPTSGGISNAPKNFPFDGAFSDQDSMDFCTAVLSDQIASLVNGDNGCVIYLNTIDKRSSSRFIGSDSSSDSFGLIPAAIHSLFNALSDQRSTHFYLTVSALEILNNTDCKSTDLLSELKNDLDPEGRQIEELKSGVFSWKRAISSSRLDDEKTELIAATVAEAAHYLDIALEVSRRHYEVSGSSKSPRHLFFAFNIYRSHSGASATAPNKMERSQLNLIELMIPEEKSNDSNFKTPSVMEFILNLISGRASPPFGTREPILYDLLRSSLLTEDLVKLSVVLHVSVLSNYYNRNLDLLQQTSKIQHIWKHRSTPKSQRLQVSITERILASGTAQPSNFSSVRLRRLGKRMQKRRLARNNDSSFGQGCEDETISDSELEYTSSSEQSCTTVIYLGRSHPLRKLNAPGRVKRLPLAEKKEPIRKAEEKIETAQVRSPMLSHHRRFKSRGGHKAPTGTITNELWVDGPNAMTTVPLSPRTVEKTLHSSLRERSDSISEREQFSAIRRQNITTEKGVPDGKAFDSHENFERQIESRMRKLNWSNDPTDSAKIAKQLEALITPKIDRKVRKGEPFREPRQHKQIDQTQQTANTSDFPTMPNWKYDSFSAVATGNMRGVKPFVKEWVERQNQAIANYLGEQPMSPKHGNKQPRGTTKPDVHFHTANKAAETPQPSRKHRNHESKKQAEGDDLIITPNDSASLSRSLPRHVTPEMLWTTQRHPVDPTPDNLSRVARWVESVSTPEQNPHVMPKGCSKHPLQHSLLCKSCNKTTLAPNPPKSPEISVRVNSAPAARFRSHHGPVAIHTIEESQQTQPASIKAPLDSRKPDGASDPGIHRDRSFGSLSGLNTNEEGLKTSPMRKPVLKRFADLFVCSPSANRRRQHSSPHHQQAQHVSKMCVPFFGGVSAESGTSELESGPHEGDLSIDSVGMLFTSMSKGSGPEGDESLFLKSEKTGRAESGGNHRNNEKHGEETQLGRLRIKEAGTKHRFGFLQSPLFSKRSTGRNAISVESANHSPSIHLSKHYHPVQVTKQHQQQDSIAFHCQVVLEKPPHTSHCHHKCVSQSSSSGLGSEHSEQHSLRCHCSVGQTGSRMRRCRTRTHRNRTGVLGTPEVEQEGIVTAKYTNGGHASSGYESVLRDDSELSSQSSSGVSYPWPPAGAKEAGCQTTPSDFAVSALVMSQVSATIPEVLTASLTDTVTVSQTGDTMQASTTSRTSGERTTSSSASKRSLSAPPGSSEESRSSSLPSVRRVSPQRPQTAITNRDPREISTPKLYLRHPELSRKKSDAAEMTKSMMNRQRRIKALLQRQEKLKAELTDAKLRLLADPGSWSFDLNVAENMDPNEEGYLEALADETELLQQRVDACRSHAQYLVYFNPGPPILPQPSSSGGTHESPH